jgi:hypothetical protein
MIRAGTLPCMAVAVLGGVAGASCQQDGCVGGDDGRCLPPAACPGLRYSCAADPGSLRVAQLGDDTERAVGPKALAAAGDFLLENDRVRAVLDLPAHPQGLAPTGGSVIDLSPRAPDGGLVGDQTNGIFQAVGVLPRDAVHYESWQVIDQHLADTSGGATPFVAVVFRGHLEGDRRVTVVTRYELRPCEPGLRVRTDVYNGAPDPNTLYLTDGFFWGDHTMLPFVPIAGGGFRFPALDLTDLPAAWREWPFMVGRSQAPPEVSYASVPCDRDRGAGFNDTTLSAAGIPLVTTLPGDGLHYERFVLAAPGPGIAAAVTEALRARAQLAAEPAPVTVAGRVVSGGAPLDGRGGRAASLLFYEPAPGANPDDEAGRTPWSEAVPGADGRFTVGLPPGRSYRVQPYAFGRPAGASASLAVADSDADIGDITVDRPAHLTATVEAAPGVRAPYAELVLVPVDRPSSTDGPPPSLYGDFTGCDPMLGPPHGGSPACNRALTADGRFDLLVPPGRFYVYATRGPFATIDRAEITVAPGDEVSLSLLVARLPALLPEGVISGDFHVHGGASYDSAIPDQDRVVSFLASGVDVIVATDHDVVTTYASTLAALGATGQITVVPGVEQTPNIIWFDVPGEEFPKTVGHFNFWPLAFDALLPRNGSPWDELREPGQMMDDMDPIYTGAQVRQLNHPYLDTKLGRDQGFLRMLKYDPRTPVAPGASFAADVLLRQPGGSAGHANLDWNVQEVMTGASRRDWLRYRALWFSLLSQGIVRAGAANSDTHTLALERVGYPRNLVFRDPSEAASPIDVETLDAHVLAGHIVGSNGPIIDATVDDGGGNLHRPSTTPFPAGPNATLTVSVTAAPWIPITEIRLYVNGQQVRTLDVSQPFAAVDHFGAEPASARVSIPLASLLPARGDAWLLVEAGLEQETPPDTDGDGLPDLADADLPARPRTATDPRFDVEAIAPGVWPAAFTNPFLLDLDGDGTWQPPGLR